MRVVRKNQMFPFFTNAFEKELMKEFYTENTPTFKPAVNIKEAEKSFELELVVPGMNKEDFKIEIDKGQLIISAEVKKEKEDLGKGYSRREFVQKSFKRSFTLSEDTIDIEHIDAKYENGILAFSLPKKEKVEEKAKQISIQ